MGAGAAFMTVPENVDGQEEARMRDAVPRIRASGVPPEGFEDAKGRE